MKHRPYKNPKRAIIFFFMIIVITTQGSASAGVENIRQEISQMITQIGDISKKGDRLTNEQLSAWEELMKLETFSADNVIDVVQLLQEQDPRIRGMAIEILSRFNQPQFLPQIASLLEDTDSSVITAEPMYQNFDSQLTSYGWSTQTVGQVAQQAILKLTGHQFSTKEEFDQWWKENKMFSTKFWYWQREFYLAWGKEGNSGVQKVLRQLIQQPPQLVAKVVLLIRNPEAEGAKITGYGKGFLSDEEIIHIVKTTISSQELLNVLDRKELSAEWSEIQDNEIYCGLLESVGLYADKLFTSRDVPRLKQIFETNQKSLGWSCAAALPIGISRLTQSPAGGYLIEKIENEGDIFARGLLVKELIEKSLQQAGPYLINLFFEEKSDSEEPDVRQTIVRELNRTESGRQCLKSIIQDPRFHSLSFEVYSEFQEIYRRDIPQELWDQFVTRIRNNVPLRQKIGELYSQRKLHTPSHDRIDFNKVKEIMPEMAADLDDLTHRLQNVILSSNDK